MLLDRADPGFQFEVLRTGRLLLCRDHAALADFVARVLQRHGDLRLERIPFLADYDAALVERYAR